MSQHDMSIANQGFPAFRADLNDALPALASNNSGATEPSTMFAHQWWVDTSATPNLLKQRNADNDAWITVGSLDQAADTFTLTGGSAGAFTTLSASGTSTLAAVNSGALAVTGAISSTTGANFATSSGNVGIGTSSPSKKLEVYAASDSLQIQSVVRNDQAGSGVAAIGFNVSSGASGDTSASKAGIGLQRESTQGVGSLRFYNSASTGTADFTASDERMRINSSGNLLVGTTSGSVKFTVQTSGVDNTQNNIIGNGGSHIVANRSSASGTQYVLFNIFNGSGVGGITISSTATSYNTSSDYRLKEDWQPMTGASERVQALKPVNFAWKVDGSRVDGFLAHEAQEVVPECVTGVKDAVDAEGKPNYQGIDQSKLVPLLTAALQEALTKIDSLTARITALEGN